MDEKDYEKRIAHLESLNDQLQTEFNHLNHILKKIGFDEGIKTLKDAAKELLDKKPTDPPQE